MLWGLGQANQTRLGPTTTLEMDFGNSTFDASFERCQGLVDQILDSGTLEIDGTEVRYSLEPGSSPPLGVSR